MTLHFLGIAISGDLSASTLARYWGMFASMGIDPFNLAISRSAFVGSSIIGFPQGHRCVGWAVSWLTKADSERHRVPPPARLPGVETGAANPRALDAPGP